MKTNLKCPGMLLVICLFALLDGGSSCELSWIKYGDICYRIFSTKVTRQLGRLKCVMEGADLASVSNVSVLDFLSQHVAHAEGDKFWVGLQWKDQVPELVWFDGTTDVEQQSWVKVSREEVVRHPYGSDPYGMGCFSYDGELVTKTPCNQNIGLICSYKFSKREKSCHWNRHSFIGESTGNCLFRLSETTTSDKVEQLCKSVNSDFVDIDGIFRDGLTAFYNHKVLPDDGSKYWTGLTWNGTSLFWNLGHAVSEEYPITVVPGSGSCITVQFNFTDTLKTQLFQTECDSEANVVCSRSTDDTRRRRTTTVDPHDMLQMDDPNLKCPEGYNWKADRERRYCYWETSYETSQLSWNDAEKYCQAFGGHISSLHSADEERLGLSFQYGSLTHPYWIGLHLDVETETYKWSDGSPLDYINWAPGHPNHKDKQLRCVAIQAHQKHWVTSLCGVHSWFICKVPAKTYHPVPYLPTPSPLESCDDTPDFYPPAESPPVYFRGACYFLVSENSNWHRAKQHCENEGANLASIHSVEEIEFLLRMLHNSDLQDNRIWIGLNALSSDTAFQWSDWTPYDFTFFDEKKYDNYQNQEKCVNMKIKNGSWSDENCNSELGFICKRSNDTSQTAVIPTTIDPKIGHCKKGWITYLDRCYYVSGKREKDRVNWTQALDRCIDQGGYLTSIRNENDQKFLSYVLQTLGVDAWIGLHDTIQSGRYYWLDNSELRYTNWAPGEPSFFGITEDCVKMVHDHLDSGVWKDEECGIKLGYICQSKKDPDLPPSSQERSMLCLHPEGWTKLDNMCFKLFAGDGLTWKRAEDVCRKEGGHLVSISDQRVKAVVSYIASELNQAFFIGLEYKKDSQKFIWINDYPLTVSDWEKNEPSFLEEDTCFASSAEGYWKKTSCEEKMPFVCQVTAGTPATIPQYTGKCPSSSPQWVPGSNSYCYILDSQHRFDWFTSNLMCFRYGSHLASIHSMSELEDIKKLLKPGIKSVYIGLLRNKKGGFAWMDDSPVDFTNWDLLDPSNTEDHCAELMADTLKWRVTPCEAKKHYLCMDKKSTLVHEDPQTEKFVDGQEGLSTAAICAVIVSILVFLVIIGAAVAYRMRSNNAIQFKRHHVRNQSVSFENALYSAGNSSMEFKDDDNKL